MVNYFRLGGITLRFVILIAELLHLYSAIKQDIVFAPKT
jgi:hypothetical protein